MGLFSLLFASTAAAPVAALAKPIDAVGNVMDKLFTSDEEREAAKIVIEKLRQHPSELQVELNKIEAKHKSIFVAGWRPAIGWVCAAALFFPFVINPCLQWYTGQIGPEMPLDTIMELVVAMLGMGGLRTYEKLKGITR